MPFFGDCSVDCCVTSPPYYGLRDYGVAGQLGLEPTPEEYVAEMVTVFREVRRVLRDSGTLWLNLGDSYAQAGGRGEQGATSQRAGRSNVRAQERSASSKPPAGYKPKDLLMIPARVALALQADGWYLRSEIIWHKPNPMPESVTDRPTSAHEKVFLLTKSPAYFYDAEAIKEDGVTPAGTKGAKGSAERFNTPGVNSRPPEYKIYDGKRNARNVWTITTKPFKGAHFATMPPDLAERCILAGTSERGACPACGSPWVRQVERTAMVINRSERTHELGRTRASGTMVSPASSVTIGWAPSCECAPAAPVPHIVLDPFGGAGTTGMVAERLGRDSIAIELNPEYAAMAEAR